MAQPVCAIVGAGEGLGRALAAKFSANGFDLALISRSEAGSSIAADAAKRARDNAAVKFFAADAQEPESVEHALSDAAAMGDVEVAIYNARGSFDACEPLEMTYDDLEAVHRLEVVGAFAMAKAVLPTMRARGHGSLFFSSATAALRGSSRHPLYAIGKFGLRALSQSLAKAYARDGVHIVHVRLDCDLDVPYMRDLYGDALEPGMLADPDDVAEGYWLAHCQPRSAWSNEIELRPHTESWTY